MDQHGELAVVQLAKRAEQLTADRDRFSFRRDKEAIPSTLKLQISVYVVMRMVIS